MTSTSTELCEKSAEDDREAAEWQVDSIHFFLSGTHVSLQEFLETRNFFQDLAGGVQHVLGASGQVEGGAVEGAMASLWWGNL